MLWPSGCVTPWPFCTRFSCSSFYFSARRVRPSLLEFRVSGPGSYRVSRPPQCGGTPLRHAPNLLSCSIGKSAISNPSLTCDGCQGRRKFSHKGAAFSIVSASILPTPGLKVCRFGHGERRREARKEVAVVLAIGHALRAHEALSRPDALSGFLEVVHRLFEDGVFVGHARSIRRSSIRSLGCLPSPAHTLTRLCSGRELDLQWFPVGTEVRRRVRVSLQPPGRRQRDVQRLSSSRREGFSRFLATCFKSR